MTIPLFHVDAFTDRPFAGNPAAANLSKHEEGLWSRTLETLGTPRTNKAVGLEREAALLELFERKAKALGK